MILTMAEPRSFTGTNFTLQTHTPSLSEELGFVEDFENKKYTYAGRTFDHLYMFASALAVCNYFGIWGKPKDVYKQFHTTYKITPSNYKKIHNAIMTKMWIDPVRKYSKDLCFLYPSSKISHMQHMITSLHEMLPVIGQADEDGIKNIIPLIYFFKKSPDQLKKVLGKGVWKKLCKNSFSRNLLISKVWHKDYEKSPENLKILMELPSTILKKGNIKYYIRCLPWILDKCHEDNPLYSFSMENYYHEAQIYHDTKKMAIELGKSFSDDWNLDKMCKKHEDYTNLINLRDYSPVPYTCMNKISVKHFTFEDYTATLLQSPLSIQSEGKDMHHCVASYSRSVANGNYLVYSIVKDSKKSSTLGITVKSTPEGTKYILHQHYKACNHVVDCEKEHTLAEKLIEELNK